MGEVQISQDDKFSIRVFVNKDDKTITISDNGIGMTAEEVKKYINQVAFSGAKDFVEKYKDKTDENQIIGHFGLGFYSAFMVSQKVRIDTLSYIEGSQAVSWESTGGTDYQMDVSKRTERGTSVTLFIAEDSEEYLQEFKMKEVLEKYFSFLPYEVYLEDRSNDAIKAKEERIKKLSEEKKDDENDKKDNTEEIEKIRNPKALNDTHPLWLKNPKDCTDDEYKSLYNKVFKDFNDPLFWIHLNMDYPFRLQGILYFPKLRNGFEGMEGQIKLFYNQVFVADNIKEVIPDFLMLLKGVLDCPDLPLNVSRSFLQNDGYVNKISTHITKKVADKLTELFEKDRESYNKYWDDINPFVKYGCIKEQKFFDRAKDIIVYKTINDTYPTLKEYLEAEKDKHENKVYYVTDEKQQAQYIKMFKENNINAVIMNNIIDNHFMQNIEMKETGVKFLRIDADITDTLKDKETLDENQLKDIQENVEKMFKGNLGDDKLKVKIESLKAQSIPCMIVLDEYMRRLGDMNLMYGGNNKDMGSLFAGERTLVVNRNSPIIQDVLELHKKGENLDEVKLVCQHLYDLAVLSHDNLSADAMQKFIERNNQILSRIVKHEN
jgi:molecular chaperone HtpG